MNVAVTGSEQEVVSGGSETHEVLLPPLAGEGELVICKYSRGGGGLRENYEGRKCVGMRREGVKVEEKEAEGKLRMISNQVKTGWAGMHI